jgi:hypothetical protein
MESSMPNHNHKEKAMSFLDAFEDVFTEPENVLNTESSSAVEDSTNHVDYFDREDEPVIW